jgi:hypothetical protein
LQLYSFQPIWWHVIVLHLYSWKHISWHVPKPAHLHTRTSIHKHWVLKHFKCSFISTIYCIYVCNTIVDKEFISMHNRVSVRQLCSPILCATNTAIIIISVVLLHSSRSIICHCRKSHTLCWLLYTH